MVKTDPQVMLAKLIRDNWNGASDLPAKIDSIMFGYNASDVKEVLLHTELMLEPQYKMPQIAVVEGWEVVKPAQDTVEEEIVVRVFIWVPRAYSSENEGTLKNWRYRMREEVKRIVKATVSDSEYDLVSDHLPTRQIDDFREGWYADEMLVRLHYVH